MQSADPTAINYFTASQAGVTMVGSTEPQNAGPGTPPIAHPMQMWATVAPPATDPTSLLQSNSTNPMAWVQASYDNRFSHAFRTQSPQERELAMFQQLQRMESDSRASIRSLEIRVDNLTQAMRATRFDTPASPAFEASSMRAGTLDGMLERRVSDYEAIAEGVGPDQSDISNILRDIRSEEPALSIAAARALATISPETAVERLPEIIKNEENKFVASILKSILRAART